MNGMPLTRPAAAAASSAIRGRAGSRLDCQVLVVGAGPTGLVLAAELLARGIRTRIIDQGDAVALQARAIGIHARTLEILDMMGLAERFTERRPGGAPPPLLLPGPVPDQPGVRALRLALWVPARPAAGRDRAAAARPGH